MSDSNQFTVSTKKGAIKYLLVGVAFWVLLPVPFTLMKGMQHIALYVICGVIAVLLGCLYLHFVVFKVTVNGRYIHVRKGLFKKFSLDVADIDRVDWIVSSSGIGQLENITVRAGSCKFDFGTFMENSQEMIAYIKDNVDEDKIRMKIRNKNV
jgi:hypothetical protein